MRHVRRAMFFCVMLAAFGCAGQSDAPFAHPTEPQSLFDRLSGSKTTPEDIPDRTSEWIAARQTPTLEVTLESTGQVAILSPFSDREDALSGPVRIWRAADESQIILREGVLIATRGLGGDIESSLSRMMPDALLSPESVQGVHRLYLVTGETGTEAVHLVCQSSLIGADVIEIGDRRIATRHVRVTCVSGSEHKVYDFWVGARGNTVWQSRQWAGPNLGYLRMRLLKG